MANTGGDGRQAAARQEISLKRHKVDVEKNLGRYIQTNGRAAVISAMVHCVTDFRFFLNAAYGTYQALAVEHVLHGPIVLTEHVFSPFSYRRDSFAEAANVLGMGVDRRREAITNAAARIVKSWLKRKQTTGKWRSRAVPCREERVLKRRYAPSANTRRPVQAEDRVLTKQN